ncbi:MAG: hypothetical protein ACKKMR_01640 [Candidatus Nealsonbacteria bacterium]
MRYYENTVFKNEKNYFIVFNHFLFPWNNQRIFSLAFFALSKIGFSEKYNYWSTLIGGILIFVLGGLLIFKPELLMFV